MTLGKQCSRVLIRSLIPRKTNGMKIRVGIFLVCLGILSTNEVYSQDRIGNTIGENVHIELRPGLNIPSALGNNFLSEAYTTKLGFVLDSRAYLQRERFYLGLQLHYFRADVVKGSLVGNFDRTDVTHISVTGGVPIVSPGKRLGLEIGLGFGYVIYENKKDGINFHDDGFSAHMNLSADYRFNSFLGVHVGVQYTRDFLSVQTAPELESFFNNAAVLNIFTGLVFYIDK